MTLDGNIFTGARFVISVIGVALLPVHVYAQSDLLQHCALVADDATRLECFDALASTVAADLKTAQAKAADTPEIPATVEGTVTAALHSPYTGWTITFDNGQRWKQIGTTSFVVNVGDSCSVEPGMLNSYLLRCGNRARRIRVASAE